ARPRPGGGAHGGAARGARRTVGGAPAGDPPGRQVPAPPPLLRQIAGQRRALQVREPGDVPPAEPGGARLQSYEAQGGAQQRRLACPVGADEADHPARPHAERGAGQGLDPAEARPGAGDLQRRRHPRQLRAARQAIMANSGAPNSAVTTPSFSSWSVGISRPARSAATSRAAPASAEGASVRAGSAPAAARTRCGAAKPTKPMTPATATAAPVNSAAPATAAARSRAIGRPDNAAVSSPRVSMTRPRAA